MSKRKLRDQPVLHEWKTGSNAAQMIRLCDGAHIHEVDARRSDEEASKYPRIQHCRRCRKARGA